MNVRMKRKGGDEIGMPLLTTEGRTGTKCREGNYEIRLISKSFLARSTSSRQ